LAFSGDLGSGYGTMGEPLEALRHHASPIAEGHYELVPLARRVVGGQQKLDIGERSNGHRLMGGEWMGGSHRDKSRLLANSLGAQAVRDLEGTAHQDVQITILQSCQAAPNTDLDLFDCNVGLVSAEGTENERTCLDATRRDIHSQWPR